MLRLQFFPGQGFRQREAGPFVVHVGLLGQPLLGPLQRGLRPFDVDFLGMFRQMREDRDAIGQDLREAVDNRQVGLLLSLPVPQLPDREGGQQRRMPGEHAEVSLDAGDLHLVHLLVHEHPFRCDDLKVDTGWKRHQPFIFSAFSTASSIVPTMKNACSGR